MDGHVQLNLDLIRKCKEHSHCVFDKFNLIVHFFAGLKSLPLMRTKINCKHLVKNSPICISLNFSQQIRERFVYVMASRKKPDYVRRVVIVIMIMIVVFVFLMIMLMIMRFTFAMTMTM